MCAGRIGWRFIATTGGTTGAARPGQRDASEREGEPGHDAFQYHTGLWTQAS